jgi:hypothetical protein
MESIQMVSKRLDDSDQFGRGTFAATGTVSPEYIVAPVISLLTHHAPVDSPILRSERSMPFER